MNHQSQKTKLHSILLTLSFLTLSCMSIAHAQPWDQTHKLLPSDGASGDQFGSSVAVSVDTAVIGAPFDDGEYFTDTGSAYVLDLVTGQQLFKILASNGEGGDNFGNSVAIDNSVLIGAEFGFAPNGCIGGTAYTFETFNGQLISQVCDSYADANSEFGHSVAINTGNEVIGAPANNLNGIDSGSATVFDVSGNRLSRLLRSDPAEGDHFGISVAIYAVSAVIGANGDDDNGIDSGSAYVFDAYTGQQLVKILPSDGASGDQFGSSVALSFGSYAVIGAPGDDDNGNDSGSAYVFDIETGQQLVKLLPSDGAPGDQFGSSISISDGGRAVIGAPGDDDNGTDSGSAYVFDIYTGQQLVKLLPSDGASGDQFGSSVSISGDFAVIGALYDDDNGPDSGSAYVFQQRTTNYLTIEPFPLQSGQDGTFSIVESLPNETSWLLFSINGLSPTFIPQLNVTVDINNPRIAVGPVLTDGNGDWQVIHQIPAVTAPRTVWFQAVQHNNVTNFFRAKIIP